MAAKGHEERFPPTRLSAGYGFRKETIAGIRRNGRDAPIPAVRGDHGETTGMRRNRPLCIQSPGFYLDAPEGQLADEGEW